MIEQLSGALLPGELPLEDVEIKFVDSLDDVLEFKEWLSRPRSVMALDTETDGLDPYAKGARIRLMQFGDENSARVINCEKWAGVAMDALETYNDAPHVWHNAMFDYTYIRQCWPDVKFPWANTWDTMILHRLHDNESSAALKYVTSLLWGAQATLGQTMLEEAKAAGGWDWNTIPMSVPSYSLYSGMDVILTARLYQRLSHIHSGRYRDSAIVEMRALRICSDMSIRGMLVDREYCGTERDKLVTYVDQTLTALNDYTGVNVRATQQLAGWFQSQGANLTAFTPTGQPKMDKEALKRLVADGFPIADHILTMKKADKLRSTYFDNLIEFSNNPKALIHPEILTMSARTGRMSVKNPALQTLPSKEGLVRNAFIAGKGNKIVTCDFSQIEMRLTAHLSKDQALIAAFKDCDVTGDDFFTRVGRDLYGAAFQRSDPRRTLIKNVMYGSTYGAGVAKMAESAKVPIFTMQPIADDIFSRFVGVKGIQSMASQEAQFNQNQDGRPYIHTATGRRLFVDPDRIYSAANYAVQGLAADMMKKALISLDNAGLSEILHMVVHDEVICTVPEADVPDVSRLLASTMTIREDMGFAVQIPAEPEAPTDRWEPH